MANIRFGGWEKARKKKFEFTIEHSYGLLFYFLYLRWCVWRCFCLPVQIEERDIHV